MAGLLTLDVAKEHLHETGTDRDAEIQREADAASAMVLGYLDIYADDAWTEITVPDDVRAAMLLLLGYLDADRGGPGIDRSSNDDDDTTWRAVASILMRRRLPSLA